MKIDTRNYSGTSDPKMNHNVMRKPLSTILIILLLLVLIGAFPTWPYSSGWGYYPSGGAGLLLLIIIIMMFT